MAFECRDPDPECESICEGDPNDGRADFRVTCNPALCVPWFVKKSITSPDLLPFLHLFHNPRCALPFDLSIITLTCDIFTLAVPGFAISPPKRMRSPFDIRDIPLDFDENDATSYMVKSIKRYYIKIDGRPATIFILEHYIAEYSDERRIYTSHTGLIGCFNSPHSE
jgi:hypothetical protein